MARVRYMKLLLQYDPEKLSLEVNPFHKSGFAYRIYQHTAKKNVVKNLLMGESSHRMQLYTAQNGVYLKVLYT